MGSVLGAAQQPPAASSPQREAIRIAISKRFDWQGHIALDGFTVLSGDFPASLIAYFEFPIKPAFWQEWEFTQCLLSLIELCEKVLFANKLRIAIKKNVSPGVLDQFLADFLFVGFKAADDVEPMLYSRDKYLLLEFQL